MLFKGADLLEKSSVCRGTGCSRIRYYSTASLSKIALKKMLKYKIKSKALEYLNNLKNEHSKVRHISYRKLETQEYLVSNVITNEEARLLFSLRTSTLKVFKANFPKMYKNCLHCPLNCWEQHEKAPLDTQEHMLHCRKLNVLGVDTVSLSKIEYSNLFSDLKKQKEIAVLYQQLLQQRETISGRPDPVNTLDPSTVLHQCCDDPINAIPQLFC